MATTIKLKNGSGAPLAGDLVAGEPALDLTNKRLYTENSSGTVIEVGTNPGASGAVTLNHSGNAKLATTSTGIDVTGEVRSDSLKVDGGTNTEGLTAEVSGVVTDLTIGGISTGADLRFSYNRGNGSTTISEGTRGSETNLQQWAGNGDISFYNSAGTSQDLFWDASTSQLGLGTTSPLTILEIEDVQSQLTIDSTGSSYSRVVHQHNGTSMWTTGTRSASDYHIFRESGTGNVIIDYGNVDISSGDLHISELGSKFTLGTTLNASVHSGAGIKASTPRLTFEPTADAQSSRIQFANTAGTMWGAIFAYNDTQTIQHSATTHTFLTSSSERMRIRSDGIVGIGVTNPQIHGKVAIAGGKAGTANSNLSLLTDGAAQGELANLSLYGTFEGTADNGPRRTADIVAGYEGGSWGTEYLAFHVGTGGQNDSRLLTTERVRIDGSGNLLVGTLASLGTGGLTVRPNITQGAAQINFNRATTTNTSFAVVFQNAGADVGSISYSNTVVAYNETSDGRLKENIVDAPSASDDIDAIQVRSFDWKVDGSHRKYGMIAQELNTVVPDAVTIPDDPEKMAGVDYSKLVPMMLKEIQSLRARVAQLEND